jgi:hypothetical protein
MTDADFMRMVIQAVWEGLKKGEMPFGACVVRKGQVLAERAPLIIRCRVRRTTCSFDARSLAITLVICFL